MTTCTPKSQYVDLDEFRSPAPEEPASGSLFMTLINLQQQLGPLIESLRQDSTAQAYVDAVNAENVKLRAEIARLKNCAGLHPSSSSSGGGARPDVVDPAQVYLESGGGGDVNATTSGSMLVSDSQGPKDQQTGLQMVPDPQEPTTSLQLTRVDTTRDYERGRERGCSFNVNPGSSDTPSNHVRKVSTSAGSSHSSSSIAVPVLVGAPERAFVINMRRLIDSEENLVVFHELLTSTAIAALTLVQAGTWEQLRTTIWFLAFTVPIYMLHLEQWDMLDVEDMEQLLPLLSDDDDPISGVLNPNSLLKGLSISSSCVARWTRTFFHISYTCIICFMIVLCDRSLSRGASSEAELDFIDTALQFFAHSEEDLAVLNLQVFVGSLMMALHGIFALYFYRETCGVMPRTKDNAVWDPRFDGVPWRFKMFGLPSMWFTSQDALNDLKKWIDYAVPTSKVLAIYPQEMAYYALKGSEQRGSVECALKQSKLFDGRTRQFFKEPGATQPEVLSIDLCFFDAALQNPACAYPGEFLIMRDDDSIRGASMRPINFGGSSVMSRLGSEDQGRAGNLSI